MSSPTSRRSPARAFELSSPSLAVGVRIGRPPGAVRLRSKPLGPAVDGRFLNLEGRAVGGIPAVPLVVDDTALQLYTRQQEVVLSAPPASACPAGVQAYWQLVEGRFLDLHVLVSTDECLSEVEVFTSSRFDAQAVRLPISTPEGNRWEDPRAIVPAGTHHVEFVRENGQLVIAGDEGRSPERLALEAPVILARLGDGTTSYTEMAVAEDCRRVKVAWPRPGKAAAHNNGPVEIRFALFGRDLEKGVILRTRLRAALISRHEDEKQAQTVYEQFISQPPPLST